MSNTKEEIACALLACRYIRDVEYIVWRRVHKGETIRTISKDRVRDYTGRHYAPTTLYEMVQKVNLKIDQCRADRRGEDVEYRRGRTVASGKRTRLAGDPTRSQRRPDEESSWNEERLKLFGLLDRWSRKR